jgi:hypothetical protein
VFSAMDFHFVSWACKATTTAVLGCATDLPSRVCAILISTHTLVWIVLMVVIDWALHCLASAFGCTALVLIICTTALVRANKV